VCHDKGQSNGQIEETQKKAQNEPFWSKCVQTSETRPGLSWCSGLRPCDNIGDRLPNTPHVETAGAEGARYNLGDACPLLAAVKDGETVGSPVSVAAVMKGQCRRTGTKVLDGVSWMMDGPCPG
jgi:hypothetical protein